MESSLELHHYNKFTGLSHFPAIRVVKTLNSDNGLFYIYIFFFWGGGVGWEVDSQARPKKLSLTTEGCCVCLRLLFDYKFEIKSYWGY